MGGAAALAVNLPGVPRAIAQQATGAEERADYTIRIATGLVEIAPDRIISTTTYNGQFPGPLIRLKEGQPVIVDIHNETDTPGLQLQNSIALILLPGDVGRYSIAQKDVSLLGAQSSSTGAAATGLLPSPVGWPQAVDVGASIDRIAKQILQRCSIRAVPFKLSLAHSAVNTDRHLDIMLTR
jgi:FtsP/CotA-like multicopper oxidase with cupredoxin domain